MDNVVINIDENPDNISVNADSENSIVEINAESTPDIISISVVNVTENININATESTEIIRVNVLESDYTKPNSRKPSFSYASGNLIRIDYASDNSYKILEYTSGLLTTLTHYLDNYSIIKNFIYNPSSQLVQIQENII